MVFGFRAVDSLGSRFSGFRGWSFTEVQRGLVQLLWFHAVSGSGFTGIGSSGQIKGPVGRYVLV